MEETKELMVSIVPPQIQSKDNEIVNPRGNPHRDPNNYMRKSSSWSWKDKLIFSKHIWCNCSPIESSVDISTNNQNPVPIT